MSILSEGITPTIHISKLEAARRQLDTALQLWFDDGEPISIHVLAFSAYDVIHAVSKKRNPNRANLLFDSAMIKDEFRGEWAVLIKTPSGFFKHARNDPEGTIDFNPKLSELLMTFAIRGVAACNMDLTPIEAASLFYCAFQRPSLFSEKGRKLHLENMPIEGLDEIQRLPKRQFLDAFIQGFNSMKPTS
jgi:hypothetical protein